MKNSGVEWIGEIPEDWEVKKLKYSFLERKSKNIGMKEKNLLSLSYGKIIKKNIETKDGLIPESFETYNIIQSGDIVFRLTDLQNDKHSLRTGLCTETGIITSAYTTIIPPKYTDCIYMNYLFHSYDICKVFYNLGAGVRQGMKFSDLGLLQILFPPKSTQQRIASYLDKKCSKIEETIQNQQQVIEKLKAYKQSLITEAVTGKIKIQNGKVCGKYESYKDSGVDYLGKIPSNWNVKRLRYIGKCQNGISKGGEFFGSGYPFVSYGDVYNNLTLPETVSGLIESTPEEQENYSVMAGDIFFTRTSETIEEVGFTSVCLKTIEKATFAGFVIRVRPFTEELIPDYSKYYFSSDAHRRFFVKEMNLVTRASLSQDLLKRLPVLIPSKEEQKEIADYLDKKCTAIDAAIEQKQNLIEKLTEYKKSLIYECVTGKKEVN